MYMIDYYGENAAYVDVKVERVMTSWLLRVTALAVAVTSRPASARLSSKQPTEHVCTTSTNRDVDVPAAAACCTPCLARAAVRAKKRYRSR